MAGVTEHLFDMREKIIAITGGLGLLGQEFTLALVERGAKVAVLDLTDAVDRLSEGLRRAHNSGRLSLAAVDVRRRDSLAEVLSAIEERWGVPHGLVNAAALDSPPDAPVDENGPVETYPESSWDQVMDVNVKGVFLACQVLGGRMAEVGRGSIVNVASIYGMVSPDQGLYEYRRARGEPFYKPVAYVASKSALYNLTRYLATYWGGRNVRVNTVTLGGVFNDQDETFVENYCARVPLGRMARKDDYNGAIVFLLSDASAYMSGSNLVIDGGWTAW